jgi:Cd2+/Zn2+-exporting ATPase
MDRMIMNRKWKIKGIDCPDCAIKIERTISKIDGIKSAKVSLETSLLVIEYEDKAFDTERVEKEIRKLGYDLEQESSTKTITLHIERMDCNEEAELIKKKIKSLHGIMNYEINLIRRTLKVIYRREFLSAQDIIKAIAMTGLKASLEKMEKKEKKNWWQERRIIFLFICGFLTLLAFILERIGLPHETAKFIYGIAIIVGGYYPAKIGLASLRSFSLNIYTLLVVAAIGAVALGLWDEAALLVFIYSLGTVLEAYAADKARGSLRALMELVPEEALVKRDGSEITLPVEEIKVGDIVIIRPGEKIPLDGVVVSGTSSVNQAPVTGESIPVTKSRGDQVFAGTINQRGSLEIEVSNLSQDTTLARIIHSVEEAQAKKSTYQRFGEKFGKYYTPAMFILFILVATIPTLVFKQSFVLWFYRALVILVVSCSCGLGLSVPVSVVAAIGNAAKKGILIKGGAYLEIASGLKVMAFDKTGTLTFGNPSVTDIISLNKSDDEILSIAAAIEARSEHPLAEAILTQIKEQGRAIPEVKDFESITGLGIKARVNNKLYYIGSQRLFEELSLPLGKAHKELIRLEKQGKTVVLLGDEKEILGIIAVSDQIRPGVKATIEELKKIGIKKVVMLTGDNRTTAEAVAKQAGVDEYRASLLPEDKVSTIIGLKEKYGKVAMLGDGINDAPAMANADVGIAMGVTGTDVALETADIALIADDLSQLSYALRLSKRSVANIKQNIFASLAIVSFLVLAALMGWIELVPGLLINEIGALIVIANGLRLLR